MARKKTPEEKEYDLLLANTRELFKHRFGKDFIWFVLSLCGIYTDGFAGDTGQTHYNSGKRAVGIQIMEMMEHADPTMYARLLLEKQNIEVDDNGRTADDADYTNDTD